MTFRSSFRAYVFASTMWGLPIAARAQYAPPGAGASNLPLAVELRKVPAGSWAEYRSGDGQSTMSVRIALVSRTARVANIETTMSGGPATKMGKIVLRMTVPAGADASVKPSVLAMQIGDNDPMLLPPAAKGGPASSLRKVDPKTRLGSETVIVPAGEFKNADHYREVTPAGETVEYWMSKTALPLGVVKMTTIGAQPGAKVVMELASLGREAKGVIRKTPIPFDPKVLMKQVLPLSAQPPGK